ncbi:MAG: hypothetical protein HYS32_04015 [Candidatus Woesearchaeota archaeon]|nr:MAG: hypothetical protein HYS32_04015 [Candidatus Woesearchaeota archaeon]
MRLNLIYTLDEKIVPITESTARTFTYVYNPKKKENRDYGDPLLRDEPFLEIAREVANLNVTVRQPSEMSEGSGGVVLARTWLGTNDVEASSPRYIPHEAAHQLLHRRILPGDTNDERQVDLTGNALAPFLYALGVIDPKVSDWGSLPRKAEVYQLKPAYKKAA